MPVLTCRRVTFYAQGDEMAFFGWLRSIKAIRRIEGVGDCILLHVPRRVSDKGLGELIAVFRRYRIDVRQLAQLDTSANSKWLRDSLKNGRRKSFKTSK